MSLKLSIIVPLYNAEKYIEDCLKSLLDQGFSENEYEILVINDGSTDLSQQKVENMMLEHSAIRLINKLNSGQAAARNLGINNAKGQYICFVDADDFLIKQSLYRLVTIAIEQKLEVLTYNILGGKQMPQALRRDFTSLNKIYSGIDYIGEYNYNNSPCYYLVNTFFLKETGLFFKEGKYCEDGMFTMELFLQTHRMAKIDVDVYFYYLRSNSTVTRKDLEHQKKMISDFIYASQYFTNLIEKEKYLMSDKCLKRCISRRNSYLFFLLIRLLQVNVPITEKKSILQELKKKSLYPFKRMEVQEYPGAKISIIHYLINHKYLYLLLCVVKKIL